VLRSTLRSLRFPRTPFLDSFRVGNHSFRIATSVVQFRIADARCEIESICSLPLVTGPNYSAILWPTHGVNSGRETRAV
jgi:hypothetical protein